MLKILKKHRTLIFFINSTLYTSLLGFISGFITYRYLAPEYLGIWLTFSTFSVYSTFLRLGIPNGLNREMPYYLGKNQETKAYKFAETTLAYLLFTTFILFILVIIAGLKVNILTQSKDYQKAAFVFFIGIITEPYLTYLSSTFRTNDQFDKLSKIQIITSTAKFINIFLVIFYAYDGYLLRELIGIILNLLLFYFWRPLPFIKPHFDKNIFKDLFKIGFRIFIGSYLFQTITTLPQLYLINYGTEKQLGLYSPVLVILGTTALIPNTISNYLYPKFSFKYGDNPDRKLFWPYLRILYISSLLIGIVVGIIIYFSIENIVSFFPKYSESVEYIKIASLAVVFSGYNLGSVIFVIFKEWKLYYFILIIYGAFQIMTLVLINYIFNDSLKTAVTSIGITYSVLMIMSIIMNYKITHKPQKI